MSPYKDPAKRKEYAKMYGRLRRAGLTKNEPHQPSPLLFTTPYRVAKANDLLHILEDAMNAVREDDTITPIQRARTLGYLVGVGIRVIETSEIEARIDALERVLKDKT